MKRLAPVLAMLARRTDILFAVFFVVIVAMMVLPLPTIMLDAMITFNLASAFVVLITTIYLKNVLETRLSRLSSLSARSSGWH